jgi:hypothetical protein
MMELARVSTLPVVHPILMLLELLRQCLPSKDAEGERQRQHGTRAIRMFCAWRSKGQHDLIVINKVRKGYLSVTSYGRLCSDNQL